MKKHSKVGNRPGKPAYRTPADFRYRKHVEVSKIKKTGKVQPKKSTP